MFSRKHGVCAALSGKRANRNSSKGLEETLLDWKYFLFYCYFIMLEQSIEHEEVEIWRLVHMVHFATKALAYVKVCLGQSTLVVFN